MTDTYTPTTEQMLSAVARSYSHEQAVAWLAKHDAEMAARAWDEAADLAEEVECIVLDPVMEKIGKNVGLSIAVGLRARAAEYRKAVES